MEKIYVVDAEKRIFMHFSERHAYSKCRFAPAASELRLIFRGAKFSLVLKF